MNNHNNILLTTLLALALSLLGASPAHAQFADCSTGLLQMPTAEMQEDGTFMITNNFLNKHALTRPANLPTPALPHFKDYYE